MLPVEIVDSGKSAKVTSRGQLITAPIEYSSAYNATLDVAATAYNLVLPKAGKRFVITDLLMYANKNVDNVTEAAVVLYEASSEISTTVAAEIVSTEMLRSATRDFIGLNLITSESVHINAKTSDDDVFVTLMGYYIDA